MNTEIDELSRIDRKSQAFEWWNGRRLYYNFSLVVAGIVAYLCYVAVLCGNTDVIPDADIGFWIIPQGIGYLFMIGIANLCFFAGPIFETSIQPENVDRFRKICYRTGYWFSVLLPFSIPVLLMYLVTFHPEYYAK